MSDLVGVRIKLARASEHLHGVRKGIEEFTKGTKPYTVICETDPNSGDQVWKITDEPAPPPDLPAIGDCLYNLRSALDHLAWQLVKRAGGTPRRATAFPLFNDPAKYMSGAPSKVRGMNRLMKKRVKACQPCFGWNHHINGALWGLEEYGNIDKHRHLILLPLSTHDFLWDPGGSPSYTHEGPVYKDTVLVRFPTGHEQSKLYAMASVSFGEPPSQGDEVHRSLYFMHHVVGMMVDEFEAAFF